MHCDKLSETKSTKMVDEGEKNTDFKYYSLNFIHSAWKVLIKCIEYNYKYKFIHNKIHYDCICNFKI